MVGACHIGVDDTGQYTSQQFLHLLEIIDMTIDAGAQLDIGSTECQAVCPADVKLLQMSELVIGGHWIGCCHGSFYGSPIKQ